jgi:hypothetical protein
MRQTNLRFLVILTVFIQGCATASRISTVNKTPGELRDVFILSLLIRDYFRDAEGLEFNLDELISTDRLRRISKNFERIEQVNRGGHIAVQYKFSNTRDYKIEFTDKERQMTENWRVIEKKLNRDFDGEIQFEYGERFYNFRKIITKKP